MRYTIGEMVEMIDQEKDMDEKRKLTVEFCQKYPAFRTILTYYANPPEWFDDYIPEFNLAEVPDGMGMTSLMQEARKLYIFEKSHPASERKKQQHMQTLLEALDTKEVNLIRELITGSLNIDGLTIDNLKEWCPGLNLR